MRHWYRRGLLAWLLWPLSVVFRFLVALRRLLYWLRVLPSAHPGVPVIVVGNLVAGGSGKTPLVIWIAEHLKKKGWTPAIVSRGYGGAGGPPRAATIASEAADVGDEPIVLARRSGCPVWIGADRIAVIAALREAHRDVDVVLLDDGLQHYRLRRDLEIAVVDARGLGNGFLLPAGPLREPASRLRSVDAVVSHGAPVKGYAMRLVGSELHRMTNAAERRPASAFAGQNVHAVAGIGDPNRFFLHLGRLGVKALPHPFPDHHRYDPRELDFGEGALVLMTEKDAVKLRHAARDNWWVLPVSAELDPAFGNWLTERLDEFRRRSKAA
ncbi:MAG: tetraacyldisaccharide 4'-kinase [Betaproteobacteria bacterium]|nr:tetraacyldisaccharide 4'-kinase [Betaproteobacteria bacterium]